MAKTLIARLQAGAEEAYIHDDSYTYLGRTTIKPYIEVYRENSVSGGLTSKITCQFKAEYTNENGRIIKAHIYPLYGLLKIKDIDTGEVIGIYSTKDDYYGNMSGANKTEIYHFSQFDTSANITHETLNGDKSFIVEVDTKLEINHWYSESSTVPNTAEFEIQSTHTVVANMPRNTEILTATNFTDEENPVITYSLPFQPEAEVSRLVKIQGALSFDGTTPDIAYRDIPTEAVNYTFQLTEAERNLLRNECADCNNKTIYYILKTTCENVATGETMDFYSQTAKTLSIVRATPSITATVEDVNATTLALTGDKNKIVKYYSNAQYEMIATASKGARITYQQITNGSQTATNASGVFNAVDSNVFVFTCSDSRENIASFTLTKELINYIHLTCNLNITAPDTDGKLNFTISGNYFNGSFGAVNNTLAVRYRYKTNGNNYGSWAVVTPTINNNTYSVSVSISGLNYLDTYTFQAEALDNLEAVLSREYIAKTAPLFDWSNNDFNFNVPVYYTENGKQYSISETAKQLSSADISANMLAKMNSAVKALTSRQNCAVDVYNGANYYDVVVSMQLIGNSLTGYIDAKRNSNASTGDINNEIVCTVEFDIDKKVAGFNSCGFPSATIGALASFAIEDCRVYTNDGSVSEDMVGKGSFNIYLTATDISASRYNGFFSMPCMLDLTKF